MRPGTRRLATGTLLAGLAVVLLPPVAAVAQDDPDDFLFERPRLRIGFNAGFSAPRAGSQIFDFTSEELTVEKDDFQSVTVAGELAYRATERVDVGLELGFAEAEIPSESRKYEGTDGLPIRQTTQFSRIPVTLNVRAYLLERGRSVSRYAWVPGKWAPFVGAGAGWVSYEFVQEGEFVDHETLDIFRDRFDSEGTTPTAHVMAGADYSLAPRVVLTGEARYSWGSAKMDRDFVGFDEIDLAGFQATVGISLRF